MASKTNIDYTDIPTLTVQDQHDSTEINRILDRFQRTGLIEHVNKNQAQYGEFSQYSYHENLNMIHTIQESFDELPSQVRKQFENDPQKWIEYLGNPDAISDMKDGTIDNLPEQEENVSESAPEGASEA